MGMTVPALMKSNCLGCRWSDSHTELSKRAYDRFLHERLTKMKDEAFQEMTTTTVEFQRIWVDHDLAEGTSTGIWRPIAPPGYRPLGDAIQLRDTVQPRSAHVFYVGVGSAGSSEEGAMFTEPKGFVSVFQETSHRSRTLTIWIPVPQEGYRALGCIASFDNSPPNPNAVW